MVYDVTTLGMTPNEIDAEVGEDGEEDEDEEMSHEDDSKRELSFTRGWRLILFRLAFISPICPAPT